MSLAQTLMLTPFLGLLIGLALGMLGGGGSILTVPILVYILGQDPHIAVATSLVIVGINALAGAWLYHRSGLVRLRPALIFGTAGLMAAFAGARLSRLMSGPLLLVLFALFMLLVAVFMLRNRTQTQTGFAASSQRPIIWWQVLLGGVSVGFLTGFLGVGGGFLVVPALVLLLGMNMQHAVGSSLVVIAMNSAAGLLGHLSDGALPWLLIVIFVLAGWFGLQLGARSARKLSAGQLRQAFAAFVVVLGLTLLAINVPLVVSL